MIHYFSFKNFYSFKEEQSVDLTAGKVTLNDERFLTSPSGAQLAKVLVCFGANASGKTNMLKALPFLEWFTQSSWINHSKNAPLLFSPFAFQEDSHPTCLAIMTESESGTLYDYSIKLSQTHVLEEKLRHKLPEGRWKMMFSRDAESISAEYKLGDIDISLRDIPRSIRRENASFISAAQQLQTNVFDDFISTLNTYTNVSPTGRRSIGDLSIRSAFEDMEQSTHRKQRIESMLCSFDTGITRFNIEKKSAKDLPFYHDLKKMRNVFTSIFEGDVNIEIPNDDDTYLYRANGVHTVNGHEYLLPFEDESNGTQTLVALLNEIVTALEVGGVAVYDEVEHGIHPNILPRIFEMFYSEDSNPLGAQLLCTCHTSNILSYLHKKQIYFAEKNNALESQLYSLDDFKGLRNDDNYAQKYITGAYGAIPRV